MNYSKITSITLVGLLFASILFLVSTSQTAFTAPIEIDSSSFKPGRIIDDSIFTDTSTMTVEEIQIFLESAVEDGQCERYRENLYSDVNGHNGPYTCLFEFQQNIETGENNYGLFEEDGAPSDIEGGLTAAEIIWLGSQEHRINPQVLLVLLQKEQSLITDNWPWLGQYARATGYHCPDTAPCNPVAADFYKQITGASWQFRRYLDYIDEYWYIVGENRILYNPDPDCGYQVVNIENKATVALYLYTPYVPNQAALNNLFGRGDNCSAYGNRNFWAYFQRWFGPTTGDRSATENTEETNLDIEEPSIQEPEVEEWSFEISLQSIYTDSNKEIALDSVANEFGPGETAYVVLDVKNTGTETWTQNPGDEQIILTSIDTGGHSSRVCHSSWQNNCQQIALSQQIEVYPEETATFEFTILTPSFNGEFLESFSLKNNQDYLEGTPARMTFNVVGSNQPEQTEEETQTHNQDTQQDNSTESVADLTTEPIIPQVATNTVVLPANWHSLNTIEKILLNPWGCHDTTQIRADNGGCLSGGYTVPTQIASRQPTTVVPPPRTTPQVATNTVVLPANWHSLNTIEKILLNPWGCHDTTQIRADNGGCLSGGYTVPTQIASRQPTTVVPPPRTTPQVATNTVVLPANWHSLNTIEKILLNPWGCHDTTQIRADNGGCLSGGYTVPIAYS